ncbi:hypothetical protein [Terriglobus tenax]|uniref:hypothetical protein n=1 Tax=Terriglobus tenax TaxID=1111115 RepID=UPI0021E0AFB1|nr:hypothetical protein [Terriglobus tenax]
MKTWLLVATLLTATAMAQNPQQTAKPSDNSPIKDAPTMDNYSQPASDYNYDNPMANPQNRDASPYCEPEQLEVKIGADNASNGQHAIPVSFRNGSNFSCRLGPVTTMRLETGSNVQMQVREGTQWVMKPVMRYVPLALESCQNCGGFFFNSGPGQDITVEPGGTVYKLIGFTTLNSSPCAKANTLSWVTHPGSVAQHIPFTVQVCAPLRYSGIVKSLPDGFLTP